MISVAIRIAGWDCGGARAIVDLAPGFVAGEIDTVSEDLEVAAADTGMLSRSSVIEAVADRLRARLIPYLVAGVTAAVRTPWRGM